MAETLEQRQLREQEDAEKAVKEHDEETESRLRSDKFVVVAPLVNVKVKDASGGFIVKDHNEGAVLEADDVEPANLRHLVDTRLLAPKGHPDTEFTGPAGTPKPGEPPNVPVEEGTPVEMLSTQERLARQRAAVDAQAQESNKRPARKPTDKQDS